MIQIQISAHHRAIRVTNKYVGSGEALPDETFVVEAGEREDLEVDDNPDWHMTITEVADA